MSAPLFFLVAEHGACVESVWAFMLMAAIHEPVELSKGDMGIDAYILLETFLSLACQLTVTNLETVRYF